MSRGLTFCTRILVQALVPGCTVALHSGDPAEADTQDEQESAYPGYKRVPLGAVAIGDGEATNASLIEFPECTGEETTASWWSVADNLGVLYSGPLDESLVVRKRYRPIIPVGRLVMRELTK